MEELLLKPIYCTSKLQNRFKAQIFVQFYDKHTKAKFF